MTADVVVIGGGLVGCAVAREAARRGMQVTVLERGTPGGEASSAAAGMLSPLAGAHEPGPFTDLLLRCAAMYPAYAAALREESGVDVSYSDVGALYLALREDDDATLESRWAWQFSAGLPVERLSAQEVRALEPTVNPAVRWGIRYPGDHLVDNRLLARAAWTSAARAGVEFRLGTEAAEVVRDRGRAAGVRLATGEVVAAAEVVVAGGCWSGLLTGLPRPVPVEPLRGQIVALESVPPVFRHVVDSPRCYTVPRADGRLLVGSTMERAGYRKAVTPRGVRGLLEAGVELAPSLTDAPIVESWAGLRPGSPDGMPILGEDAVLPGVWYATGHAWHGILLGPLTAWMLVEAMSGGAPEGMPLLSPARFH